MECKFSGKVTVEDYIQFSEYVNKRLFSKKFKIICWIIIIGGLLYIFIPEITNVINLDSKRIINIGNL